MKKLFKLKKSKSEKLVKSKKLLKNRNLFKFYIKKIRSIFLIFDAKTIFNHLWLAFIKALIFQYFNWKYYI